MRDEEICQPAPTENNIAISDTGNLGNLFDHVTYYMKNDTLGELSNMHVAVSDQKALGPKDPLALEIAAMINVQVDFAKHSECISRDAFQKIKA